MATYLGRTIVTIPSYPPAPQSVEPTLVNIVAENVSPFTGQQQIYSWGAGSAAYRAMRVNWPPMTYANFQNWIAFLQSLNGIANVFQFGSAVCAAYPLDFGSGVYWCLVSNSPTWTLRQDHLYTLSFEIRQAI